MKDIVIPNIVQIRKSQNAFPNRKPYDVITNNCIYFVKQVAEQAGVETPWMIDPRPNSYSGVLKLNKNFDQFAYTDARVFSAWDANTLCLTDGRVLTIK